LFNHPIFPELLQIKPRVQKNPGFLKTQPTGFLGFGLYRVFQILYLNEQLGSVLVDFTHQLSFYLDFPVL